MELELSSAAWRSRSANNLCDVVDVSSSTTRDGNKLVLVTTKDEIIEYCTQSKKNINHWTFRAGGTNALSVGAVRHPLTSVYYGIRGGSTASSSSSSSSSNKKKQNVGGTIVTWKSAELDVTKWKTSGLGSKSKAFGLYTHPHLSEECLVVFEDGSFAVFDEDLHKIYQNTQSVMTNQHQVFWATLVSDHRNPLKGNLYLSMIIQQQNTYQLVIYQVVRSGSKKTKGEVDTTRLVQYTLINPPSTTTSPIKLTSCAFHADILSYSLAWSNGDWEMVSFSRNSRRSSTPQQQKEVEEEEENELQVIGQKKMGLFLPPAQDTSAVSSSTTTPNKKRKLNISISPSTFIVGGVGCFNYLVVAEDSSLKMTGWDAKFGVQVSTCDIESSTSSSTISLTPNKSNKNGKLLKFVSALNGENVICMYERAVFIVNVRNKHSTLASVLGCSTNSSIHTTITGSNLQEPMLEQLPKTVYQTQGIQEVDSTQWQKQVLVSNQANNQLYQELLSNECKDDVFIKKFDTFWKKATTTKDQTFSYGMVLALTKKCLSLVKDKSTKAKAAPWQVLDQLIETKRLSSRAVPILLQVLIQENQIDLLDKCIDKMTDIEEKMIVRLLKFYIRQACTSTSTSSTSPSKTKSKNKKEEETSGHEKQIVKILCLPTNNVFLHHAIHQFQLEEVLLLLSICKKYLFVLTEEEERKENDGNNVSVGPSFCFCEWICVLLDGHFTQLVLTASQKPEIATLISHLETLVTKQLDSCEQFEKVQRVLGNFITKDLKLPKAHGIPDYSIETFYIH